MIRAVAAIVAVAGAPGCDLVFPPGDLQPDARFDTATCPVDYVDVAGAASRYRYVDALMSTWQAAEAACAGAAAAAVTHLVVFDDGYPELAAVRNDAPFVPPWNAWVGYARNDTDGLHAYTAVTGEPLSEVSNLWEPGEPDGNPEFAVRLEDQSDLLDAPGGVVLGMICECDGRPPIASFTFP